MRQLFFLIFSAAVASGATYITTKEVAPPKGQLTFYGASDIYYVDMDKLHLGTESGEIDSTFESSQKMSEFLEVRSADDSNGYDEWVVKATKDYTEVHICGSEVSVVCPDVSSDSLYKFKLNASDTLDDGSIVFYTLD